MVNVGINVLPVLSADKKSVRSLVLPAQRIVRVRGTSSTVLVVVDFPIVIASRVLKELSDVTRYLAANTAQWTVTVVLLPEEYVLRGFALMVKGRAFIQDSASLRNTFENTGITGDSIMARN